MNSQRHGILPAAATPPPLPVEGRRVTVFGIARSGVPAAHYLASRGAHVTIVDQKPACELATWIDELAGLGVTIVTDLHDYAQFGNPELVITSPGVPSAHPFLQAARESGALVIGELELAYRVCSVPLIAITGTNGKGTVTTLTRDMLLRGGVRAAALGNIGTPLISVALGDIPYDVIVTECSSFQLETIDAFRPWIAMFLNLSPDHINRHPTMQNYLNTKSRIFMNQTKSDFALLNLDDPHVASLADSLPGTELHVSLSTSDAAARLDGDELTVTLPNRQPLTICNRSELPLKAPHNVSNVLFAATAAAACGVSPADMLAAIQGHCPAEHLMTPVGEVRGITFIDDSKATNIGSATADIHSIEGPITIICGGDAKGVDLTPFAEAAAKRADHVIVIGTSGPQIAQAIGTRTRVSAANSLDEAVRVAFHHAAPASTVMLAPACASFDMFRNMSERGNVFAQAVQKLEKELER